MATQNTYDTAIVISNDGDYESAFQGVKDLGRKVELVYFRYKVSWNLKRIADISRKARRSFFEKLNFDVNNPGVNGN
jgi:uncharacterized LabA/DUF88 family protein